MAAATFDIFDQAALTGVINRPLESRFEQFPSVGDQIAPLNPVQSRVVKIQAREVESFGVGQYRAPGATPPLTDFQAVYEETAIELALLDEMNRIKDEDWLNLQSSDEGVQRKAGVSLVERGNALALRNRRLSEVLRWQAFTGGAVITYPNGSEVSIDYGINATPDIGSDAGYSDYWDNHSASDPIADFKKLQKLSADAVGFYGTRVHMGSDVLDHLIQNQNVEGMLTGTDRPLSVVRQSDLLSLLRDGTEFIVTDGGYRDVSAGTDRGVSSVTPYLDPKHILITTPYVIDGERIADLCDGQVIVSTGYNQVAIRQGAQAEVLLEHVSKTHFFRYGSARIPRILVPGAFVYAKVLS